MAKKQTFLKWQEQDALFDHSATNIGIEIYLNNLRFQLDRYWKDLWQRIHNGELTVSISSFEGLLRETTRAKDHLSASYIVAYDSVEKGKKYLSSMYMRRRKKSKSESTIMSHTKRSRKITI
jgi:hypothetical protein